MLYEGTTQIQALDLLGRKVLMSQGETLKVFTKVIHKFCKAEAKNKALAEFISPLNDLNKEWGKLTMKIGMKAMKNRDEVGAAAVDYLMYGGYITLACVWALQAKVAQQKLEAGEGNSAFYQAKIETARFYFARLLPRTKSHEAIALAGASSLMTLDENSF